MTLVSSAFVLWLCAHHSWNNVTQLYKFCGINRCDVCLIWRYCSKMIWGIRCRAYVDGVFVERFCWFVLRWCWLTAVITVILAGSLRGPSWGRLRITTCLAWFNRSLDRSVRRQFDLCSNSCYWVCWVNMSVSMVQRRNELFGIKKFISIFVNY